MPTQLRLTLANVLFIALVCLVASGQAVQVQLVWELPKNLDGTLYTGIAGYKLYYGQSSRNYSVIVDVGNKTTHTIDNLAPGQTYYFAVTAYSADRKESDFSNEIDISLAATRDGTSEPVTLYIAYDGRTTTYPTWLTSSYTPTGNTIATTDAPLSVWRKEIPPGPTTLPGNKHGNPVGVRSNYIALLDFGGNGNITGVNPSGYQVASLNIGDTFYIDRSYTVTAMPQALHGLTAIKTANNDKDNSQAQFVTFTLNKESTQQPPVEPVPVANFTATPTTGTAPLAVQFTDTSQGTRTAWAWTFGDGATSSAQHPAHT